MEFLYKQVQTKYLFLTFVTPALIFILSMVMSIKNGNVTQGLVFSGVVTGLYSLIVIPIGFMRTAIYTLGDKPYYDSEGVGRKIYH